VRSATFDSNIFISALNFGGEPLRLLDMAEAGEIRLDVSAQLLDEVERVPWGKFGWPIEDARETRLEIEGFSNLVNPTEKLSVVADDADDDKIVECAAAARSDYLITGDRHLLKIKSYRGTQIVRAAEFLALGRRR
jgi:uncharacterized protein